MEARSGRPKRKMQNVDFEDIEDFLAYLPEKELDIVTCLRDIVLDCIPDCEERLAYNVPYYRRHANICFIWPPSITWGGSGHQGVRFGFTSGYLLQDESGYLDKGGRKQVYWRDFFDTGEIDVPLLKSYLYEAVMIDREKAAVKKKKSSKKG